MGSWCTMMMTPIPAMKPVMIGAERKSAIHPRRSSPTPATSRPVTTAVAATRVRYCVEPVTARCANATAKSGAMVESAPTETMGFEPTGVKASVAAMKRSS